MSFHRRQGDVCSVSSSSFHDQITQKRNKKGYSVGVQRGVSVSGSARCWLPG